MFKWSLLKLVICLTLILSLLSGMMVWLGPAQQSSTSHLLVCGGMIFPCAPGSEHLIKTTYMALPSARTLR